jgi:pyridoxal phosphate enzyme (YggS family)
MSDVVQNCRKVMDNIGTAAKRSGREPREIQLLAACKSQGAAAIRAAISAGVRLLGENYVQEAKPKVRALAEPAEWHLIGHLQRNKVKQALELFSVIETLDSIELARVLDREAKKKNGSARTFVQVNLGGEQTKAGISENGLPALLEEVGKLGNVRVEGLMLVPPLRADPQQTRVFFRGLKNLQAHVWRLRIPHVEPRELSMGMTHDYDVAIEEGATIVRIGTAIFGERRLSREDVLAR